MSSPLFLEHTDLLKKEGMVFQPFDLASITDHDVLLLIDCQNDFFQLTSLKMVVDLEFLFELWETSDLVGWREYRSFSTEAD